MNTSRDQVTGRVVPCHHDGSLYIKQRLIHTGRPHQLAQSYPLSLIHTVCHPPTVDVRNNCQNGISISHLSTDYADDLRCHNSCQSLLGSTVTVTVPQIIQNITTIWNYSAVR